MAANLSVDGKLWKLCRYCRIGIWRYPKGQVWRGTALNTTCQDSPIAVHVPEYG